MKSVLLDRCEGVCLWRDPESSVLLECKYSLLFAVEASPKAPGASLLVSSSSNQKERWGGGWGAADTGSEDGRTQFFPFP